MRLVLGLVWSLITGLSSVTATAGEQKSGVDYVTQLRAKYGARLTFVNPQAAKIVNSFEIDCRSKDGRYLPFVNVLYARLADTDGPSAWLVTSVESRGGELRVVDTLQSKNGPVMAPTVSFEINKWGELRPIGTKVEALLNACYGSHGSIFVIPKR